jgi:hypothetical protein
MRATPLFAMSAVAAALLSWLCIVVNFERACAVADTPYLELCPVHAPGSQASLSALRSRLQANPGDTKAYVQLALTDRSPGRGKAVLAAARLAPNEPNILTAQAAAALDRQDWAGAAAALVQLTEYRDKPQAALALAAMIAAGHGPLLADHLTAGSRWFRQVLAQMARAGGGLSPALPLVVRALQSGVLDVHTVLAYVRQLKAAGAWVDAYSLWLSLSGRALPLVYNGGFDEAFQPDGFDWEVGPGGPAGRAGAFVERRLAENRGAVLDIRFTGRALQAPLIRQYLFIGEGRYRLRGDYMARQLRIEQGLAWTVACTAAPIQAGKSGALVDSAGVWQPFSFEISVPPGCGLVASLQLETFAPSEAALGARGRVAFDALSLEKVVR